MIRGVDFIGDVHGHADHLAVLLENLGYKSKRGAFKHKSRHAVFIGDILNRGPAIRGTVVLVRSMVDCGSATLLLGNHELNALIHAAAPPGHPAADTANHPGLADTLRAFSTARSHWNDTLEWLLQRPLTFTNRGARAVHACWAESAASEFLRLPLRRDDLRAPNQRLQLAQVLTNGITLTCPADYSSDGKPLRFRVRWWLRGGQTWRNAGYPRRPELPDTPLPQWARARFHPVPKHAPPLFFGHYGFIKKAEPLAPNLACLDLGIARGHPLCAYRWSGETSLARANFIVIRGNQGL